MKSIIVLSGGMDSTTALYYADKVLNHDLVATICFNYGSKHNDREYEYARYQSAMHIIPCIRVDLQEIGKHLKSDLLKSGGNIPEGHYADPSMKKTVVPFRNGIMLSVAAGIAESMGAKAIVLGNHFGDHAIYPDCRSSFVEPMKQAIIEGTYEKIELVTPFTFKTKAEIAGIGAELGVDFAQTYSCYNGGEFHCGKCGTCFERKEAFVLAGLSDPTDYMS
ncbi:MAG: 7-cyano-7-deazaguanine synthase QueC [Chlamydiales bacterium]